MLILKRTGFFDIENNEISDSDLIAMLDMQVKSEEPISLYDLLRYLWSDPDISEAYDLIFNYDTQTLFDEIIGIEQNEESEGSHSDQEFEEIVISKRREVILKKNEPSKLFETVEIFGAKESIDCSIDFIPLSRLLHTGIFISEQGEFTLVWPDTYKGTKFTVKNSITVFELYNSLIKELTRFGTEEDKLTAIEEKNKAVIPPMGT